jgi:hypothetical protein
MVLAVSEGHCQLDPLRLAGYCLHGFEGGPSLITPDSVDHKHALLPRSSPHPKFLSHVGRGTFKPFRLSSPFWEREWG